MNTKVIAALFLIFSANLLSCTKAYNSSPTNTGYDPLNKNPAYNWGGTGEFSATIVDATGNTTNWVADGGSVVYSYVGGYNEFTGNMSGKKILSFWLGGIYPGNTYVMGLKNGSQYFGYTDSASVPTKFVFWTYNAAFNTGGVDIIRSDTFLAGTSGYIKGLFFGDAIDSVGRKVSVSNGYFNIQKW